MILFIVIPDGPCKPGGPGLPGFERPGGPGAPVNFAVNSPNCSN